MTIKWKRVSEADATVAAEEATSELRRLRGLNLARMPGLVKKTSLIQNSHASLLKGKVVRRHSGRVTASSRPYQMRDGSRVSCLQGAPDNGHMTVSVPGAELGARLYGLICSMVPLMRLFISHAAVDLEIAEAIRLRLEEIPGVSCFVLATDVFPGDDWEGRIRRAAHECDGIACVVTPDYIKRPWFYAEWAVFWFQEGKTWYLLMMDTSLDDLFDVMRGRQTAFLDDRRSVERLLTGLATGTKPARGLDLLAAETVQAVADARMRRLLTLAKTRLSDLTLVMKEGQENVSGPLVDGLLDAGMMSGVVAIARDPGSASIKTSAAWRVTRGTWSRFKCSGI